MQIGYLDCAAGVAGDMWVGALLDAGVPFEPLQAAVAALGLPGVEVSAAPALRAGLAGTHFRVAIPEPPVAGEQRRHARHLPEILALVARAGLPAVVTDRVEAVFRCLAQAEAGVHGQSVDTVHFHEVGAEDAIVDIVCACLGLHVAGIERLYAGAVAVGSGTVRCAHGELPVPAPGAWANLLGLPVRSGGPPGECVTPTGAALLRVLVDEFEPDLAWVPHRIGYGAGTRDPSGHPNLLRLTVGQSRDAGAPELLFELTCTLDTITGEQLGYLLESALARGAADAFVVPVHMKKGRPGHQLTVLTSAATRDVLVAWLLEESTSLGVRQHAVHRHVLERWCEVHQTSFGQVRCKAARLPSGAVVLRPEDDEVVRIVAESGRPRREVAADLAQQLTARQA